jgi:hypothetical protein
MHRRGFLSLIGFGSCAAVLPNAPAALASSGIVSAVSNVRVGELADDGGFALPSGFVPPIENEMIVGKPITIRIEADTSQIEAAFERLRHQAKSYSDTARLIRTCADDVGSRATADEPAPRSHSLAGDGCSAIAAADAGDFPIRALAWIERP